jgi:O-antigen ligase
MSSLPVLGRLITVGRSNARASFSKLSAALVFAALALPLTSVSAFRDRLPLSGTVSIFASDVLVALAIGLWALDRVINPLNAAPLRLRTPVLSWPLALLAVLMVPGIYRGHERYGASFVGQPLRLILYAAIALAMVRLTARAMYVGVTSVLYAGAILQAAIGLFGVATGRTWTEAAALSTGGTRYLSLSAGMYMGGAFVLALVNLDIDRSRRGRLIHASVAVLALLAVVLAFGRTTFIALAVLLPALLWHLKTSRTWLRGHWKALAGAAVMLAALATFVVPEVGSTLADRVSANPFQDRTVRWRVATIKAALGGMGTGRWEVDAPLKPRSNSLQNAGFEDGLKGWAVQGGALSSMAHDPSLSGSSARIETFGVASDEGLYSVPYFVSPGQIWAYSIWLRGQTGGEHVNISLWAYDKRGGPTGQVNLPAVLTTKARVYSLAAAIRDPNTDHVRVLVRTRDRPQRAVFFADGALLLNLDSKLAQGWDYLSNWGFENGVEGWGIQGGTMETVTTTRPGFGESSLRMRTAGAQKDEGVFSNEVPVRPGDQWKFTISLEGLTAEQRLRVGIWQYGDGDVGLGQSNNAFTLEEGAPATYSVRTTITNPRTTHIRAVVRTDGSPEAVDLIADAGNLELVDRLKSQGDIATAAPTRPPVDSGQTMIDEPLLGLGFGRSLTYSWENAVYELDGDPHNSFVWVLGGAGFPALTALLLLLGLFVRDTFRRLRRCQGSDRALIIWALATWFVFVVNTLMEPVLSDPALLLTFWVVMLAPALVRRESNRREL